jgi:xanthine dehydrogenase molybdenum-binding subunit
MEIYVGSQIPYQDRTQVARAMGWDESRVRIVGQLMGGGFGGKEGCDGADPCCDAGECDSAPCEIIV